jgi:xylulokinase
MACDIRIIVEGMNRFPAVPDCQTIHCFGGESQNRLLMQIKASVMKQSLTKLGMTEAVSLGAALLGGVGAGIYRNLEEALAGLKVDSENILPHSEWVEAYQKHYEEVFSGAWQQVKPLQDRLLETYEIKH